MTELRVQSVSVSLDGFAAGPDQALEHPMGVGGMVLHEWVFPTKTFRATHGDFADPQKGDGPGESGVDDDFAARGFRNVGAWILGRNMFGPQRGPWLDESWKGWWGAKPPFRVPVFVLTHHPRPSLTMEGATTFHFVTDGLHEALRRAREAAQGRDVRLGGGAATIRAYLREGLVDEMHLAMIPVALGRGEPLFAGLDLPALGYRCVEHVPSKNVTHVVFRRER